MDDMDKHFILAGLEYSFPLLYSALTRVPLPSLQHFFQARERLIQVGDFFCKLFVLVGLTSEQFGQASFKEYLSTYGRQSGRKDLLSKVVSLKTDTGEPPLTDRETYVEIGNLVFAGSGMTLLSFASCVGRKR